MKRPRAALGTSERSRRRQYEDEADTLGQAAGGWPEARRVRLRDLRAGPRELAKRIIRDGGTVGQLPNGTIVNLATRKPRRWGNT